jgi:hypothetical protein
MWTLIIITIAFSGALSGASSSTAYLDFADQSKCEAAATAIGAPDWIRITPKKPPVALSNRRRLAATSSSPDACSVERLSVNAPPQKPRKFPFVHKEAAIQHTVRYTELAPDRFKNFWRD